MNKHDTFTFLVTTDNHLGFRKDDSIRSKDSFMAFSEALEIARLRSVDFVLLGGDLFHENRPSTSIEHKCIKIIRKHMVDQENKKTTFRRIDGDFSHFHKLNHGNFEDPNMSIGCPIMTIHGNHDDPTGPNGQSICEKLATCGLLNYFGAVRSIQKKTVIKPIVFQKDQVKIALYGLGFIPDAKLKTLFQDGKVVFMEPPRDTFNVLIVHQNRIPFQKHKYIPDDTFPTFFHLIIRGHEHNTQAPGIIPESEVNGMVYQPGSTVATSISTMEVAPKKVCLVSVRVADLRGDKASRYKMDHELIELKCCRKILMKDISQKNIFEYIKVATNSGRVTSTEFKRLSQQFVEKNIRELLKNYQENRLSQTSGPSKLSRLDLPLVKIRLEYTSKNERFDELDVAAQFYPKLVSNKNMILFKKQKLTQTDDGIMENTTFTNEYDDNDDDEDFEHVNLNEEKRDTIDYMIEKYFLDKPLDQRLKALSISEYTNAIQGAFEDGNVIAKVLDKKRRDIFIQYRAAIVDEEMAEMKFHNQDLIERWFIRALQN